LQAAVFKIPQAYEAAFGIDCCPTSYLDLMTLGSSYKRNGAPHRTNETLADSFAQPFLKPISTGNTNNTEESEIVAKNYIWSVRLEHTNTYMQQEVQLQ
jgi:hypothetical protein